ncbi:MAG: DctP family TRAP transporter solute-binding subunit [Betaproteobacteria bacterium]|nr:DctP family TRAP transporter solute-binding subunit [Betaproteobacteria bacterium]
MKKFIILAIAATAIGFQSLAHAQAPSPIVIKFSHVVAADTAKGKAIEHFKKLAEEKTKGAVRVDVFHNSTLYKDKEELEALQMGAVQMLAPTPGKFGPLGVKEFEALDLPFLFDNFDEELKITKGPIGQQLLKKLETRGVHGLAFWNNGFKQLTSNKPIRKVEDFKGQKIRIVSSKVIESQMRSVGALSQVMAFGDLYTALQTGVVDGQENPTNVIYPTKLYEVQKYMTLSDHSYHGYAVVTNPKFWAGLPPDIRAALEAAMAETTEYFHAATLKENQDGLDAIRKSGKTQILALTPEERKGWKKAMARTHEEMADRIGRPFLQSIYKETNFDPARL